MGTEKLDPQTGSEGGLPERETREGRDGRARKECVLKDDGRYIVFYDFENESGED
jgi:hypothetical protein